MGNFMSLSPLHRRGLNLCRSAGLRAAFERFRYRREYSNSVFNGLYDVLLPDEPHQFGVAHIAPNAIPSNANVSFPDYRAIREGGMSTFKDFSPEQGMEKLRKAAKLARDVREHVGSLVEVGVTTSEIDSAIHDLIISKGAYPSPLLYRGFPKSCCTSVNNVLVHGIPDERPLEDGDIVNVDITVFLDGFHGDTSKMWLVGDVDPEGRALCEVTAEALERAIAVCGPGMPFKGIGNTIHQFLNDFGHGTYSVSENFTGHGIGQIFHTKPWIVHSRNDEPGFMQPGDCFTIEPCIIEGSDSKSWTWPDGWTASTENGNRAAQYEHMVLITEDGAEVLTR